MNLLAASFSSLRRMVPKHNVKFEAFGSKSLDCGYIVRVAGDQGYFFFKTVLRVGVQNVTEENKNNRDRKLNGRF